MLFSILTIFPNILNSPLQEGIIRRAQNSGLIAIEIINIRDFAKDKHAMTDDRPFGGGEGMIMKPEPLSASVQHVRERHPDKRAKTILLSPQGKSFNQPIAERLSRQEHLILVCGRYEGVDHRFIDNCVDEELSLGDYILSGGELGAMVILDAVTRVIPGALGSSASAENDTFSRNLLKYPQYTRPRIFAGQNVPEELLSGDHQKIEQFRFLASVERTMERRPDLLRHVRFNDEEMKLLKKHGLSERVALLKHRGIDERQG